MEANTIYNQLRQRGQRGQRKQRGQRVTRRLSLRALAPALGVLGLLAVWQVVTLLEIYPTFIIPTPVSVVERLVEAARDGSLWSNTWTTLVEMLVGLAVGLVFGVLVGYAMAKSRALEDALSPLVLSLQSTPVVAYAPLLVIWFGSDERSKIITCALIVFFPMLMNTLVGIRTVPPNLRDLMRSLRATRWQTFTQLEVPAALPVLFGGLKVSAVLAVIGAVVGEFIAADSGLGYLINRARYNYDTALVFAAILVLALIARGIYGAISVLERRALAWQARVRKGE